MGCVLVKEPERGREEEGTTSIALGGLGLESEEEGEGFRSEKGEMDCGSTASEATSKGFGSGPIVVGNCFWRSAKKSSSGRVEKDVGCWAMSQ